MRSWFGCTVEELLHENAEAIAARLAGEAAKRRLEPNPQSMQAWTETVHILHRVAGQLVSSDDESSSWYVGLEFELPRRQRRIDGVLLAKDVIVLIEVKEGAVLFDRAARWQAEQYARDLRDFHEGSRNRRIVPVVVASRASSSIPAQFSEELVQPTQCVCPEDLGMRIVEMVHLLNQGSRIEPEAWEGASYRPTPSIVDAARYLYDHHDVRDISAADAHNLDNTVEAVVDLVDLCRTQSRRGIAFITGAPVSGKTLAGLQVVHDRRMTTLDANAGVFLSGNRPLVEVISAALADSSRGRGESKKESARKVSAFVQHAYSFRNEYAENHRIPHEHVVLFGEAQRAWDSNQVSKWTQGRSDRSEPQILLDVMSRVPDWSIIIAMVGGGQEINSGEAGLGEWGQALHKYHADWIVAVSHELLPGSPERAGGRLFDEMPAGLSIRQDPRLHLTMNVRSPRAERLNRWVDALIQFDVDGAREVFPGHDFPFVMTRSLERAKAWLRDRTDEDHRFGLVASADARRLRAWGLDTNSLRMDKSWADWFLKPRGDVRSSFQLEVPATNFDCQGLELDWVGVCWGNDMTVNPTGPRSWTMRQFRGNRWTHASRPKAQFMQNSYRVLLTRARLGQVIWVPSPSGDDPTLLPEDFDAIANVIRQAGVPELEG